MDQGLKRERTRAFAVLACAIAFEVCGATAMKLSEGFTMVPFTLGTIVAYVISFGSLIYTLKHLPLGLAYGIWGGVGTAATALIGIVAWGDPFGWGTCVGLALVAGGIVLLNCGTEEIEAKRAQGRA